MLRFFAIVIGFLLYDNFVEKLYIYVYPYAYKATLLLGIFMPDKHRYLYRIAYETDVTIINGILFLLSPVIIILLLAAILGLYIKLMKMATEYVKGKKYIQAIFHFALILVLGYLHLYVSNVGPPL